MKLTDLRALKQRNGELVAEFIQRFRDVRNRCYNINMTDGQLAELAFQGLLVPIKEKFSSQEFKSLGKLVQRVSAHENRFQETRKERGRIAHIEASSGDEKEDIGVVEWVKTKKPIVCPWIIENVERYDFNINKANKIFDMLLQEKQIQLSPNHTIPSVEELRKKRCCK